MRHVLSTFLLPPPPLHILCSIFSKKTSAHNGFQKQTDVTAASNSESVVVVLLLYSLCSTIHGAHLAWIPWQVWRFVIVTESSSQNVSVKGGTSSPNVTVASLKPDWPDWLSPADAGTLKYSAMWFAPQSKLESYIASLQSQRSLLTMLISGFQRVSQACGRHFYSHSIILVN